MEEKDLKEIKKLFVESFGEVWEGNIAPSIQALDDKATALDDKMAQLPTKSYFDDKLAKLEGGLVVKLRKEDLKLNRLAEILKARNILTEADLKELADFEVFPQEG